MVFCGEKILNHYNLYCGLVERLHARLMILKSRFNPDIRYFSSFAVLGNEELLTAIAFSGSKSHKNRIYYLLS